jgi:hypothetical protein
MIDRQALKVGEARLGATIFMHLSIVSYSSGCREE